MVIAVFAQQRELLHAHYIPKSKFVYVKHVNDIRGRRFDGVINFGFNPASDDMVEAYNLLKQVQPELWTKIK